MGVFYAIDINIRGQVGDNGEYIEKMIEMLCKSYGLNCDIQGGFCENFREDKPKNSEAEE